MFSLFKKTTPEDRLYKKYEKLMQESHKLTTTSRAESEKKYVEAQEVLTEIENLKSN